MKNISLIIKEHCKTNNVSIYSLASMLNLRPATLYRSLNSRFLTIERLQQISQSLNHNFFIYFLNDQSGSPTDQLQKLTTENKELSTKLASLQKEVTYLQEIIALLKARQ